MPVEALKAVTSKSPRGKTTDPFQVQLRGSGALLSILMLESHGWMVDRMSIKKRFPVLGGPSSRHMAPNSSLLSLTLS